MAGFTRKNGALRFYDAHATTPYYLDLDFEEGDFAAPIAVPRAEESLVLPRGKMGAGAHYLVKSDEAIMAAIDISFSMMLTTDANCEYVRQWIAAMNDGGSTTINSNTLTTTKGTTQRDGSNNNPSFADTNKLACNVEYLLTIGSDTVGWKYAEVWFDPSSELKESADGVMLSVKGKCYGTIEEITAFTTGTDIEA